MKRCPECGFPWPGHCGHCRVAEIYTDEPIGLKTVSSEQYYYNRGKSLLIGPLHEENTITNEDMKKLGYSCGQAFYGKGWKKTEGEGKICCSK